MSELTIGEVARQSGLKTSTLRYYERFGLLPRASRRGGQRVYDEAVLHRLAIIQTAQQAGFSLAEIAILLNEILPSAAPGPQWHDLIQRKWAELNTLLASVQRMRALLEDVMRCDDPELADCIPETGRRHALLDPEPVSHPPLINLNSLDK